MAAAITSKDLYATPETLRAVLEEYGVAIIPKVLNPEEIKQFNTGGSKMLSTITANFPDGPVSFEDETSWRRFYTLMPLHSMLLQHFEVGHSQHMWDVRQNPKVAGIFAKLWSVKPEELLVSFSGMSIHFPPEVTNRGWFRSNDWLHCDQDFRNSEFNSVQSWVTGYDITEEDATLRALLGSHKLHHQFYLKFKKQFNFTGNWHQFSTPEERQFYKDCQEIAVACPAGSMVFWDSRTIHCGREPLKGRKQARIRHVGNICYTPRRLAKPTDLVKKRRYFLDHRTTRHTPHAPNVFSKMPRTFGRTLPTMGKLPDPVLTTLGKALAGF
jgi:hypothetical protein